MVSTSTVVSQSPLLEGLTSAEAGRVLDVLEFVTPYYANRQVVTEQNALQFVEGVVSTLAFLKTDVDTRIAGLLFELPEIDPPAGELIGVRYGAEIAELVSSIRRLMRLRDAALTQHESGRGKDAAEKTATQLETLRKMVLAMATDMRVVLV
ncbi:MAG: HD domain-containing protein, partial [Burkholderiaceae bacterium]|nr:HD domain-containing protein [Burkholderiaceae bacterium]